MIQKFNKYIFLILLAIAIAPIAQGMEIAEEEIQEQNLLEALPSEMLSNILEQLIYQLNIDAENANDFDNALKKIYLINHLFYNQMHIKKFRKIILDFLLAKTRKLERWKEIIDWVSKHPNMADQELILKAQQGDIKRVKSLLIGGTDINARGCFYISGTPMIINGHTPLANAIVKNNKEIVQLLLNLYVDTEITDLSKDTPLIIAVKENNLEILKMLLSKEVDINHQNLFGNTALMIASQEGSEEAVRILLEAKAKVDIKNYDGITALKIASVLNFKNIVQMLLDAETSSEEQS